MNVGIHLKITKTYICPPARYSIRQYIKSV